MVVEWVEKMVIRVVQPAEKEGCRVKGWWWWWRWGGGEGRRVKAGGRGERMWMIGWRHEQDGCRRVVKPRGNRAGGIVGKAEGEGRASVLHPAGVWSSQVPRGAVLPISIP